MSELGHAWKLKLYGGFELIAPGGGAVRLPYKSAQALVAVLALNRGEGMRREELGRILWPGSPLSKRQENLRQTIAAAKAALGPDRIEASRTHCRFADEFRIVTDHEDAAMRGQGAFMPGFDGDWFDRVGRRGVRDIASARLIDSFLHLLLWLAEHDPAKVLGHMRDNHGLAFGLSYTDRRELLDRCVDDPQLSGWKGFFDAAIEGAFGESPTSVARLNGHVVSMAEANSDRELAVHASSQVSLMLAWQNRSSEAISTIDWCLATAASCPHKGLWATATQMKGNILIHAGKIDEGLAYLERAEQMYRDPIDSAIMRALRGFYLASLGRREEAGDLLDSKLRPSLNAGHGFLNNVWDLAEVVAGSRDLSPEESLDEFGRIVSSAHLYGDTAIAMVAEEEYAKALSKAGDSRSAENHMAEARKIRRTHSRLYTAFDKMRLAS